MTAGIVEYQPRAAVYLQGRKQMVGTSIQSVQCKPKAKTCLTWNFLSYRQWGFFLTV